MSRDQRPATRTETNDRRVRQPLGLSGMNLAIHGIEIPKNKVARWIRDNPGRLPRANDAGWQFVVDETNDVKIGDDSTNKKDPLSTYVRRAVGAHRDGRPMFQYLMVIDREWFEQDQAAKQRALDLVDKEMLNTGNPGDNRFAVDGQYIPNMGISVEHKKLVKQPTGG